MPNWLHIAQDPTPWARAPERLRVSHLFGDEVPDAREVVVLGFSRTPNGRSVLRNTPVRQHEVRSQLSSLRNYLVYVIWTMS